jgi:hypothetical protein
MSRCLSPRFLVLALCLLLGLPATASALEVGALYRSEVAVETRDRPERQEAFATALDEVLVRITGNRSIAAFPEAQSLRDTAARYVLQFRYRDTPEAELPFRIEVRFDGAALERVLLAQGLPVWGSERPATLMWVAVQDRTQRRLAGAEEGDPARAALQDAARLRGLPLVFPLFDLEDQGRVAFADVAGGFDEAVLAASQRYAADAVVVARALRERTGWSTRWRLYLGGQAEQWESRGAGLREALEEGVHDLAGRLASRLATSGLSGPGAGTLVAVTDLDSLGDLARVRDYLSGLAPVQSVRSYRVGAGRVDFLTELRGDARDLERLVRLGSVLEPLPRPLNDPLVEFRVASPQTESAPASGQADPNGAPDQVVESPTPAPGVQPAPAEPAAPTQVPQPVLQTPGSASVGVTGAAPTLYLRLQR